MVQGVGSRSSPYHSTFSDFDWNGYESRGGRVKLSRVELSRVELSRVVQSRAVVCYGRRRTCAVLS